jgi:AcrR family transcriptional regulator
MRKSKQLPLVSSDAASPKRVFRQARASNTARRIIDAANQLLNSNRALSNEAIAETANVSVSSIYRYFNNRSELFAEMFRIDADNSFALIGAKISQLDRSNYRQIIRNIVETSAQSVSGERAARIASFGSIDYEVAQEINIKLNLSLCSKLVEQVALISNCHPRVVDNNLITILSRLLVATPRVLIVESPGTFQYEGLITELSETAVHLMEKIFARADATHG